MVSRFSSISGGGPGFLPWPTQVSSELQQAPERFSMSQEKESASQIKMRAERLGDASEPRILYYAETEA